jgi:feruloyl-CoA synthase
MPLDLAKPKYRPVALRADHRTQMSRLADGSLLFTATEPLGGYPRELTEKLVYWADQAPERVFAAQRDARGRWREVTYAAMLERVRSLATALVGRELSAERPIAILSGNDLEHLQLALAAMWVGIPYSPVSPSYSLAATDFDKLRRILAVLTPGLVFAADAHAFAPAIAAAAPDDADIVLTEGDMTHGVLKGRRSESFASLLATPASAPASAAASAAATRAHAALTPDTIAKLLFTSGSTSHPKAVVTTQRMLCANQQMMLQCMRFLGEKPPVLLDWLPWNHVFGGSHNVGLVLYNGGTLYLDDGKPTAQSFARTVRNLREIAPTIYFNVPKGWEDLALALEADAALCKKFFSRLDLLFYSGASLSQAVWDRLDRLAEATVGERIQMSTGFGMTETAPSCLFTTALEVRAGDVGLPAPGCEVKLVPQGGKLEARFRGPHVMPGYWRDPEQTRNAFDADGFYRTGDAFTLIDPSQPDRGFAFDGRVAEDFKLATGTFVSVGPLVLRVIAAGSPYVLNAVVTGMNRNDVGLLIFPRIDLCRTLAAAGDGDVKAILAAPAVRSFFQSLIDRLSHEGTGSSNRIARAYVLPDAPSFAHHEITDKGSINQRAVLEHRAALIEALYSGALPDAIIPRPPRRD